MAAAPGVADGRLTAWEDVADEVIWDALLVGNGLSINIWPDFEYASLFKQAQASGHFTDDDEAVFEALGVESFEAVLHSLTDAIAIGEALGEERPLERRRHRSIQAALAHSVQGVHVSGGEVPADTYLQIRDGLRDYRRVFSTSYDLLVYWAAAKGERPFHGFVDYFWAHDCNAFDESTITIDDSDRRTRLYFLHRALHIVLANGLTAKRRATMLRTLLDQFGEPYEGDDTARPLVITEGHAADKQRTVDENDYLSYCWRELRRCDAPLVIFGQSLSMQDTHLVAAVNEHPERPLAVGLRDHGKRRNRREQHRICSLLDAERIYFFDSASHPLGEGKLALRETPWRRRLSKRVA